MTSEIAIKDATDEAYEGGYADALDDAWRKIDALGGYFAPDDRRGEGYCQGVMDALFEIGKLLGRICPDCDGSGKRKEITERDILDALFVSIGGRTNVSRDCKKCHGYGVTMEK